MSHPITFLIGLHGCGKTTVGRLLALNMGWHHFSLGDLGRLARQRCWPPGIDRRVMYLLAGVIPGTPLSQSVAMELVKNLVVLSEQRPVIFDGFPSEPGHIELLPEGSKTLLLVANEMERCQRLHQRAAISVRKWTPGLGSERDRRLPQVVAALGTRCIVVDANGSVERVALSMATALS